MEKYYKEKYLKYKKKYLESKEENQKGGFNYDHIKFRDAIAESKIKAQQKAYDLLQKINKIGNDSSWAIEHQIVTSESATAGLLFATIANIPFAGWAKYGSFGVYDTNAKRLSLGVEVKDVYTHKCAKEMAIGALKNSNASIAISITGNAMPDQTNPDDMKKLGEVFIGVAGYKLDSTGNPIIHVETQALNMCKQNPVDPTSGKKDICSNWYVNYTSKEKLIDYISNLRKLSRQINDINETNKSIGQDGLPKDGPDQITKQELNLSYDKLEDFKKTGNIPYVPRISRPTLRTNSTALGDYEYINRLNTELKLEDTNILNKFADIFVTDAMQEFIRYKMVQYALSTCLMFINENELMVPNFIKHSDGHRMDDDYYINEIKKPDNVIFNKLINEDRKFNEDRKYAIENASCKNDRCNDSERTFTAEFDL